MLMIFEQLPDVSENEKEVSKYRLHAHIAGMIAKIQRGRLPIINNDKGDFDPGSP